MKSIVKTAGSFDKVLASCKSIGEHYQPKAPSLSITALSELSDRSQQAKQAVISTRADYRMAVNSRQLCFAGIPKLSVRVVNMLAASEGVTEQDLADANSLKDQLNKLTRKRKSSTEVTTEGNSVPAKRAARRKHFEMKAETLASLVEIVQRVSTYDPYENDLKLDALMRKVDELTSKSRAVEIAAVAYGKASKERKELVFGPQGVDETVNSVKRYVRAAFGVNSTEARQLADTN